MGRDDGLAEQLETGCVSEVRGGGRRDDDGSAMMQSQESIELVNAAVQEVLASTSLVHALVVLRGGLWW